MFGKPFDKTLVGKRVEIHPRYGAWMMGDRFGEVVKVGPKRIHVRMDRSHRTLKVSNDENGLQRVL